MNKLTNLARCARFAGCSTYPSVDTIKTLYTKRKIMLNKLHWPDSVGKFSIWFVIGDAVAFDAIFTYLSLCQTLDLPDVSKFERVLNHMIFVLTSPSNTHRIMFSFPWLIDKVPGIPMHFHQTPFNGFDWLNLVNLCIWHTGNLLQIIPYQVKIEFLFERPTYVFRSINFLSKSVSTV